MTEDPPPQPVPRRPVEKIPGEYAYAVHTEVVRHDGQWAVDIIVVFADGVVRRRVGQYRSEREARLSATYIRRGAEREG